MRRKKPCSYLDGIPCSIVAVSCALGRLPAGINVYESKLREDGYASLKVANRIIRDNLDVIKRTDYKRGERPLLKDLHLDGKAIVCVLGHLIYVDHETYHSLFDNETDEVVTVWKLKGTP